MNKFKFTLQDGKKKPIVFYAGRTSNWDALDYTDKLEKTPSLDSQKDFYWVYFAAKQTGNLEKLGVDEESTPEAAVRHIADTFDECKVEVVEGDSTVPLA